MEQDNQTTAAGASVGDAGHAGLLDELLARVAPCFARRETRVTCRDMVRGLLMELDDHNCWTMAEAAGHASPYRMRHLLSRARVDELRMLDTAADWAAGRLSAGRDDAVLVVDETADAKSSDDCADAPRQYSGILGGIALCQVTVTLTYAAPAGHALIGRALYLPADWVADEERRELAGVPDEVMFATKPELAGRLLQRAHDRGIRAGFVAGDEVYGGLDMRRSIRPARLRLRPGSPLQSHGDPALRPPPHRENSRPPGETRHVAADAHRIGHQGSQGLPLGDDRGHARRHPRGTGRRARRAAPATAPLHRHRQLLPVLEPRPVPLAKLITVAVTRWRIEPANAAGRQVTGAGGACNRTARAVERTVPFAFLVQSLMICWYAVSCDPAVGIAQRRQRCPWYRAKTAPAPADMRAALRAALTSTRINAISPGPDDAPQIIGTTLTSEAEAA